MKKLISRYRKSINPPYSRTDFLSIVGTIIILFFILVTTLIVNASHRSQQTQSHASGLQPVGPAGNWNMIFSDEFNSTAVNTAIWTPGWFGTGITQPVNTSETACYDSKQISEPGDGYLHLHLISQSETCGGVTRPYTGSLMSSNGHFQYTYGYLEVRAYIPPVTSGSSTIANWPAIWSDGQSWPTDGENDTMEGLSGQACFHFHSPSGAPGNCVSGTFTGWHTFGSDWEPGVVTYYYDGIQVGQITSGITTSPQYFLLDNTTSPGSPTTVPADMQIDYVRVWQPCTSTCTTPTPVPPTPTGVITATPIPTNTTTPTPMPSSTPKPTLTSTPVPSATVTPTPLAPTAPLVSVSGCIAGPVSGTNNLTITWNDTNVDWVNISPDASNLTYYNKSLPLGVLNTTAPSGFTGASSNVLGLQLVLNPNTTYYATVWDGVTNLLSKPTSFSLPLCPTPTINQVDTTPPSVSITLPVNGTTVKHGSTIAITASATDNIGITKVVFYDNSTVLATDTAAPYTASWSVPGKPNITYTLKAVAFDAAGNTSSSTVTVKSK